MPTLRRVRIVSALRVVFERVPIHVLDVQVGHASVDAPTTIMRAASRSRIVHSHSAGRGAGEPYCCRSILGRCEEDEQARIADLLREQWSVASSPVGIEPVTDRRVGVSIRRCSFIER